MSHWWRAYDHSVDNAKLQRLPGDLFKAWYNLCCLASANKGTLPSMADLAFKLRVSEAKARNVVETLQQLRLVDEEGGAFRMHEWDEYQYKSDVSTERVKRFRKRARNVSSAVAETPPESESDTDSEANASAQSAPELEIEVVGEDPRARLFRIGKPILISFGISEKRTGSLIGQWLKTRNDPLGLLAALMFAREQNVAEPVAYVSAIVHGKGKNGDSNGTNRRPGESLGDLGRRLAARARELELAAGIECADEPFRGH